MNTFWAIKSPSCVSREEIHGRLLHGSKALAWVAHNIFKLTSMSLLFIAFKVQGRSRDIFSPLHAREYWLWPQKAKPISTWHHLWSTCDMRVSGCWQDIETCEIFSRLKVHEWFIGKDMVKSKIEIDPATQMDAGIYECTADNQYSVDRRSFKTDFSIAFD